VEAELLEVVSHAHREAFHVGKVRLVAGDGGYAQVLAQAVHGALEAALGSGADVLDLGVWHRLFSSRHERALSPGRTRPSERNSAAKLRSTWAANPRHRARARRGRR